MSYAGWDKDMSPEERAARQKGGQVREEQFKAAVTTGRPAKDAEVLIYHKEQRDGKLGLEAFRHAARRL
jgi:hypothetical protein